MDDVLFSLSALVVMEIKREREIIENIRLPSQVTSLIQGELGPRFLPLEERNKGREGGRRDKVNVHTLRTIDIIFTNNSISR